MSYVNSALESSELTAVPRRARLELAFTRDEAAPEMGPTDVVEVALPSVSRLTAKAATEPELDPALVDAAIRHDLEHSGVASAEFERVLALQVLDVARDPLTWRTAHQAVGPRLNVVVRLLIPRDYPFEPPQAIDVALIYHGEARADADLDRLTEAMTPEVLVPSPAVVLQARRNAQARTELLSEFGALTASQVAELSGSEAKNRSALAGRWRREGRLVAVEHHGTVYYPAFQFDGDGKPRPVVERVLNHLDDPRLSAWQQALWFTTANGWLDGRRPVDLLESAPDAVTAAARDALREPVG